MSQKTTFSAVKSDDLVQAGVVQGYLVFRQEKIEELLQSMGANVKDVRIVQITLALYRLIQHRSMKEGHERFSMRY